MPLHTQYRPVNPYLGTGFATFTSAVAGTAILLAIFEQLGINSFWLGHLIIILPVLAYVAVGITTRTVLVNEFYVSGRRVPPFYNGLAMAANVMGGVGYFSVTGALFLTGFDALAILLGWGGGFVLMAVLFAPYLRKFGAYTIPGFLAERFQCQTLRYVALFALLPPAMLILSAELVVGAEVAAHFVTISYENLIIICAGVTLSATVLGGMRSLTWTQCAQYIVVILGFLTPLFILAVIYTNLPLPQLTYGLLLDDIVRLENAGGIVAGASTTIGQALPFDQAEPLSRPFLQPFSAYGWQDFAALMVCFMMGTAAMPGLLMRASTSQSVASIRWSASWGTALIGIMLISIPAYVVFAKYLTLQNILGQPLDQMPGWFEDLRAAGFLLANDENGDGVLAGPELSVMRDRITLMLPIMAGLPFVLVGLVAAAGISAALGAAGAQVIALANTIGEDLFHGRGAAPLNDTRRLMIARLTIFASLSAAIAFIWNFEEYFDVLRLLAWALSLLAASFFPALVMAVWWKRATGMAVSAGMLAGFAVTAAYIVATEYFGAELIFGVDNMTAAVFGAPLAVFVTVLLSILSKVPDVEINEIVLEMRVPRGETTHDRILRLESRSRAKQTGL